MKQTAVEWFCNEMGNLRVKAEITNMNGYDFIIAKVKLLQQAKEMEKEQMLDIYIGHNQYNDEYETFEEYYKETFKSE